MARAFCLLASVVVLTMFITLPAHAQPRQAEQATGVTGRIEAVTVYRGQALVTRRIPVTGELGMREVIVRDLPAEVVPGSIYAESAEGVQIRSVLYRVRAEQEDVREEVRNLDQQIQTVDRQIKSQQQQREVIRQQSNLLDKFESFTAPSANWEMARGVLDAETIQKLSQYLMEQRATLGEKDLAIVFRIEDLNQHLNQLRREHANLTRGSSRTAREAVVFLEMRQPDSSFRLRYLVNEASWSPSYNVRATTARDAVAVEYLASIRQRSGEDWNGVAMTLSTATPMLAAQPPRLSALRVSLADPRQSQALHAAIQSADAYKAAESRLRQQRADLDNLRGNNFNGTFIVDGRQVRGLTDGTSLNSGNLEFDIQINTLGAEQQMLELYAGRGRVSGAGGSGANATKPGSEESISVTYVLAGPTTLPSRSDQQLIRIAEHVMEAAFYRLAIPVLTEHVYEEAQLVNTLNNVLLAGPVSSYLAGEFVGHGELPTVAEGETFTVGFGIDSSLRAHRELVDRQESTQGGNILVTLSYRLILSNFSSEPRTVRVFDRLPVPAEGSDVRVRLLDASHELNATQRDPRSAAAQSRNGDGRLRWDVEVPARAVGVNAAAIEYRYTLEHDRLRLLEGAAR